MKKEILNDTFYAKILRVLNPGFSWCSGCGKPWSHCESKTVDTSKGSGTFATCQKCWNTLTLNELKTCYTYTYRSQQEANRRAGYDDEMNHTLEHLLNCVEKEMLSCVKKNLNEEKTKGKLIGKLNQNT